MSSSQASPSDPSVAEVSDRIESGTEGANGKRLAVATRATVLTTEVRAPARDEGAVVAKVTGLAIPEARGGELPLLCSGGGGRGEASPTPVTLTTVIVSEVGRKARVHCLRGLVADLTGVHVDRLVDVDRFGSTAAVTLEVSAATAFAALVRGLPPAPRLSLLDRVSAWSPAVLGPAHRSQLPAEAAVAMEADLCRRRLTAQRAQLGRRLALPPHVRAAFDAYMASDLAAHAKVGVIVPPAASAAAAAAAAAATAPAATATAAAPSEREVAGGVAAAAVPTAAAASAVRDAPVAAATATAPVVDGQAAVAAAGAALDSRAAAGAGRRLAASPLYGGGRGGGGATTGPRGCGLPVRRPARPA